MRKILLATAAAALFAGPALAQSNITVVTPPAAPPQNTVIMTPPQTAAEPSPPAYESKTVEHSNDGLLDTTRKSKERIDPDGSTSTSTQVIKREGE